MSRKSFPEVPGGYPFPGLELEHLESWRKNQIFAKTLEKTADSEEKFVFYEGPPTANNRPHVGHVVTRVIKDLFPRFKTMRGAYVARKAGWDTHGLAVEIEVEKSLGFSGKQDIENFGVKQFNQACLDSVHTYERQWREMTERIGFWIDLDSAYYTYSNRYIESVWWALHKLFNENRLGRGYKIQPYCARCGTTLSSHEVAQNYKDTDDPSVWVRFPVRKRVTPSLQTIEGETWNVPDRLDLVAWTTTPWTLLGHSGLAVHSELTYKAIAHPSEPGAHLLFAENLETAVPLVIEDDGKRRQVDLRDEPALARFKGSDLAYKVRYDKPFTGVEAHRTPSGNVGRQWEPELSDANGWGVFPAEYVTADDGTGIVHTAPAFGQDDYESGELNQLPMFLTVDSEGKISGAGTEPFTGMWIKDADKDILRTLREQNRILHADRYHHNYPFCWRCDQPLLYYASLGWFIRTNAVKNDLIENNKKIDWHPAHVKDGRFGKWLENVVDWAVSRKRYWGTPLPIWRCDQCPYAEAIGSFEELFRKAGRMLPDDPYDRSQFDPHRPFVDRETESFVWNCPEVGCEGMVARVEEVIDAWFDSGAMPFAQHHYMGSPTPDFDPDRGIGFPADFISEAVDQTRGWFYTLHALGTLLFGSKAYDTCIVLGHINDEKGRKMSKRLGNVTDPMDVIPETGADAMRWYFCINNPEASARFSARLVREAAQALILPLWNALSFFTIYANLDDWAPGSATPEFHSRPPLDRWILLRLGRLIEETTDHLEGYRITDAAQGIEAFVDDLTNWYIRRSRDRFWASTSEASDDKESAYQALYEVLTTVARLIAPFTPFLAETLHQHLEVGVQKSASASIHLEDWPQAAEDRGDEELERGMKTTQRIVSLGHAARNTHGLKIRQPLLSVTVVTADPRIQEIVEPQIEVLRDELNVREVLWAEDRSIYVHHEVRPIYPKCGPRFGKQMQSVRKALDDADGDALAEQLDRDGAISIQLDGEDVHLSADEVEIRLVEHEGAATQGDRELLVALDSTLTPELIAESWAREIVHRIQVARKAADLDYDDRIKVRYRAAAELEEAVDTHRSWIAKETLAVELVRDDTLAPTVEQTAIDDMEFALMIAKS
jgi:isoleucyl-tRNA synthetase